MKRESLTIAVVGAAALALAASFAWAAGPVGVDIPFRFAVAGKEMPAGQYVFETPGTGLSKLAIKSADGGLAMAPVLERLADTGATQPSIVFDLKGGKYYLSEYHVPGQDGLLVGMVKGEQAHKVVIGTEKK